MCVEGRAQRPVAVGRGVIREVSQQLGLGGNTEMEGEANGTATCAHA